SCHFLHSSPRYLELLGRCLLRLLHELVKNDDATVNDRAVEDPRNSLRGLDPEFEQAATHSAGVRHSQVWTEQLHSFGISDESRDESGCEVEDLRLDAIVEESDGPSHRGSIAYSLCRGDASERRLTAALSGRPR